MAICILSEEENIVFDDRIASESLMAWFVNRYCCTDCNTCWEDEWSCTCDDECPNCGSGDWSPVESEDLTFLVEPDGDRFAVLESPLSADDRPRYFRIAVAPTAEAAQTFISLRRAAYWD